MTWSEHESRNIRKIILEIAAAEMKRPTARQRSRRKASSRNHRLRQNGADAVAASRKSALQRRLCALELDLTSLKQQNERLLAELSETRESGGHFAKAFEQIPAALVVLNDYGAVVDMNAAGRQLLQISRTKPLPDFFGQFVARTDVATFLRLLRDCKLRGRTVSAWVGIKRGNSDPAPFLLSAAPLSEKSARQMNQFCLLLADESERVLMEQRLRDREQSYQEFLDSMDAVLWEADAQTLKRTYVSRHVERMLGYRISEWLAEPDFWQKNIPLDDRERVLELTFKSIAARQNFTCEYRLYTASRSMLWVRDRVSVLEENNKLMLRGVTLDITETNAAQEKLQEAHNRLEHRVDERTAELQSTVKELEAFSYTLSHDLRAPLRSMHGYAELVEELCGDQINPEAREYLKRIRTSAFRLDTLIQDVLKYSKISQAPVEARRIEVEQLVRQVLTEYPVFQSGQADIQIDSPLESVMGHEGFLTQCISNLLSNAVKFVPKGTKPRVRLYTQRTGDQVRLCFEDNGIGIEPDDQRRIFRIFQRLNPAKAYEGTGIGLAIVQRAAERMGGHAGVDSAPGRGSTFWLQLWRAP
jgi:PAS domain S-box-containing protein